MKQRAERLISLRVSDEIAVAMAELARREFLPLTAITRRALADDLRRRGYLADLAEAGRAA